MKKITSTLLFLFLVISTIQAQDFKLFEISEVHDTTFFISLSDIYSPSDHPDSLAIPEDKRNLEHIVLGPEYRKHFLSKTKISESDKIFIYNYVKNELLSFPIKKLEVVANLSPYEIGGDTPHEQYDYMFGFQIDKTNIKDFEDKFYASVIYVGKENPFAQKQLTPIVWKKISAKEFPSKAINDIFGIFKEKYTIGNSHRFDYENMQYFIQDFVRDNFTFARRLLVVNSQTKKIFYEKMFHEGESDSLQELNFASKEEGKNIANQWTGKLFKNKETALFGFEYHSFGCPYIMILDKKQSEVPIYCDNRH